MKRILAVLGIQAFVFHSNFFKNEKKHVRLTEEELQKIEDALEKQTTAEDAEALASLQANENEIQEALTAAFEMNKIEMTEGQSISESIAALGQKCKEYGDANPKHSTVKSDGKNKEEETDDLKEGYFDPTASHNIID